VTTLRLVASAVALLLAVGSAHAGEAPFGVRAGDVYEIRWEQKTQEKTGERSSGSSSSRSTYAERIVAIREAGVEVEFDLPDDSTEQERQREWLFPARILKRHDGSLELLNGPELEERLDAWLERAEWPREVCGRWYFTWSAFQVNCDPQSVLRTYEALDVTTSGEAGTETVDAEAVRRGRAEADVIVAQINGRVLAFEEALAAHSSEQISGTVATSFERDAPERLLRTQVTELEIVEPDGVIETRSTTETVTRTLLSRPGT
jgi:hypothetical protein